jgi:AraC-like DNA-binding protein
MDAPRRRWHEGRMAISGKPALGPAPAASISWLREHGSFSRRLACGGSACLIVNFGAEIAVCRGADRLVLSAGEVALLSLCSPSHVEVEGVRSEGRTSEPAELLIASFLAGHARAEGLDAEMANVHLSAEAVTNDGAIADVVKLLRAELPRDVAESGVKEGLLFALLGYVERAQDRKHESRAAVNPARVRDRQIARALELMRSDLSARLSVAALAKAVGLSRAQFARRFAAVVGVPPLRYLTEQRLNRAAELLEHDDDSLADIALRVGYESEFAFSRAFKRFTGEAPGQFRRRIRAFPPATLACAA